MGKETLQFSVSSISCSEASPLRPDKILIPRFATETMVQRAITLKQTLEPVFGNDNISISLHPASVVNVPRAAELLSYAGVYISSIDIPDVITNWQMVKNILNSLRTRNFKRTPLDIGWRLQNVGSKKEYKRKLDQGLSTIKENMYPQIVRTHAGLWINSTEGDELRRKLSEEPNVVLAVEIEADKQTPSEYIDFILKLSQTNDRETPVYADIDLGHFGESKYVHRGYSEIPEPLQVFEKIIQDRKTSKLVAVTTLNQYVAGDPWTHSHLLKGPIDYTKVAKLIGKATKEEMLPFSPMLLAEFYPYYYKFLVGADGIFFCRLLAASFHEGHNNQNNV